MRSISEIRRARLVALINEFAEGNASAFARLLGKSRAQIGFWTAKPGKPGAKAISDRTARDLEKAMGKPHGWMDTDPDRAQSQASHATRPDPSTISRTHQFLASAGGYDLGNLEDADLFADVYEWIAEKDGAGEAVPDNLVSFQQWLRRRDERSADEGTAATRKARKTA